MFSYTQTGHAPPPKNSGEWLQRWNREKLMWVPVAPGRVSPLKIHDIAPTHEADFHVTAVSGRRFYVLFKKDVVLYPRRLPTLVVPDLHPENGWWILERISTP